MMDASNAQVRDCFPTTGHRSHSLRRACTQLHESKHGLALRGGPAGELVAVHISPACKPKCSFSPAAASCVDSWQYVIGTPTTRCIINLRFLPPPCLPQVFLTKNQQATFNKINPRKRGGRESVVVQEIRFFARGTALPFTMA